MKFKIDNFVLAIIAVVIIAYFFPEPGSEQSKIPLNAISSIGVSLIFFFYGLKLSPGKIKSGLKNWKLHVLIQSSTYLLFPAIVILAYPFLKEAHFSIWLAFLFLAALPSTVSSSVVMVSIAKGNVTSAIFNASISGIIGILMTPLLMSFFLTANGESGNQSEIIQQLLLKVLLPIILGILLNPIFKKWVVKYSNIISEFDRLIILLIVYESFSHAFIENIFVAVPALVFVALAFSVVFLFFATYYILKFIAEKFNFKPKDVITTTFCGSKKSLVHGSLFLLVLGIPDDQKVLFLLPVMIYHSFQLFYVSWLANKIAKRAEFFEN